jgi:hypothetical protein
MNFTKFNQWSPPTRWGTFTFPVIYQPDLSKATPGEIVQARTLADEGFKTHRAKGSGKLRETEDEGKIKASYRGKKPSKDLPKISVVRRGKGGKEAAVGTKEAEDIKKESEKEVKAKRAAKKESGFLSKPLLKDEKKASRKKRGPKPVEAKKPEKDKPVEAKKPTKAPKAKAPKKVQPLKKEAPEIKPIEAKSTASKKPRKQKPKKIAEKPETKPRSRAEIPHPSEIEAAREAKKPSVAGRGYSRAEQDPYPGWKETKMTQEMKESKRAPKPISSEKRTEAAGEISAAPPKKEETPKQLPKVAVSSSTVAPHPGPKMLTAGTPVQHAAPPEKPAAPPSAPAQPATPSAPAAPQKPAYIKLPTTSSSTGGPQIAPGSMGIQRSLAMLEGIAAMSKAGLKMTGTGGEKAKPKMAPMAAPKGATSLAPKLEVERTATSSAMARPLGEAASAAPKQAKPAMAPISAAAGQAKPSAVTPTSTPKQAVPKPVATPKVAEEAAPKVGKEAAPEEPGGDKKKEKEPAKTQIGPAWTRLQALGSAAGQEAGRGVGGFTPVIATQQAIGELQAAGQRGEGVPQRTRYLSRQTGFPMATGGGMGPGFGVAAKRAAAKSLFIKLDDSLSK